MENMNFVSATLIYLIAATCGMIATWNVQKQIYKLVLNLFGTKGVIGMITFTAATWTLTYWAYNNSTLFKVYFDYAAMIYLSVMIAYVLHIKIRKPQA